jgi:hypothetical protein
MNATKIGSIPKFNGDIKNFLEFSELLLNSKVDGLFATDHTRNKDVFNEHKPSCSVILGLYRAAF